MSQSDRAFHVLLALHGAPRHGYAIKKAVLELSAGSLDLEPGGLYRLIGRLEDQGLVAPVEPPQAEESKGPPRNYYAITESGRQTLYAEATRLSELVARPEVAAILQTMSR